MDYKLLESNGVENENVDGAAFNNIAVGGESGVILGVLNGCSVSFSGSLVTVNTGELIISGFRVKITSPYTVSRGASASDTSHHIFARIYLKEDRSVTFSMGCREVSPLTQDSLFVNEKGTYEIEIASFKTNASGIYDLKKTVGFVSGGGSSLPSAEEASF